MKIIKCLGICLLAILVSAGFESCGEDEYVSRLRELILKDMTFGANEDDGALSKTTTFRNEDISNYLAVSSAGWCHVTMDASKSQMTVTVDENTTYGERKATITMSDVKAPAITRTFTVTQKQNNAIIVNQTYFLVETKGGQLEIDFEHNINDFEIICDADWIHYKLKSGTRGLTKSTIAVSVDENTSGRERKGYISIESNLSSEPVDITIEQEYVIEYYFRMLTQDYDIDELGGNISVVAQTNKTTFDIWEPEDIWARLGELEFFTELNAISQHVNVAPFTEKEASRTTTMGLDTYTITITQYRNLYIKEYSFSMLRQESKALSVYNRDGEAVKWSSSDESVAKVDANGVVTGVGVGKATITATSSNGKYKDSITVTIEKPEDLREFFSVEWQPYFDGNEVASLSCTLNNGSEHNIQLTRCEIYSDLKLLSYMDYSDKSGQLKAGDSKKASFDNLAGKGSKFGFTVVWYYNFNGEKYTYRCEYMP
jgi:hypothetical protein